MSAPTPTPMMSNNNHIHPSPTTYHHNSVHSPATTTTTATTTYLRHGHRLQDTQSMDNYSSRKEEQEKMATEEQKTEEDDTDMDMDMDPEQEYTEEPHATRRREILRKYPQIKKLMGYDPRVAFIVSSQVIAQILLCWKLQHASWTMILVLGYFLSPFFNHSLAVAMHEVGHNLAFGHRRGWMNRVLGIWCNLPLTVPMAITFKKYHSDHHRFLGDSREDVDVPCRLETLMFHRPLTKFLWIVLHPFFYAVRPFYKSPKPLSHWELTNVVCQLSFNALILAVFGLKSLVYLFLGLFFGLSLHPLCAHFISEHYFLRGGDPTHSYYGPLNFVLFNAGFHNEHHDFPYVPCTRLPEIRRIAPEYYQHLPQHPSWVKVLWDFIFDQQIAPHAKGQGADMISVFDNERVYRKAL